MPRFLIEPTQSLLVLHGRSTLHPYTAAAPVRGYFEVELNGEGLALAPAPSGQLTVDVTALHGEDARYDREMRNQLDVQRFPRITGVLRELRRADGGHYRVTGDLTLRGQTRVVEGDVVVRVEPGGSLRLEGAMEIDVRHFGIKPPRFLMFKVHPHVHVRLEFVANTEH